MGNAIAYGENYGSSGCELTQNNLLTEDRLRQEWKCVVVPFPRNRLSELSGVTTQAAGLWIKGERAPSTSSVFNLARSLPSIQMWGAEHMGISRSAACMSIDEVERALHVIGARDDAEGRIARKMLVACYAIREGSENVIPPMVRVAWDLIDQRTQQSDRDTRTIDLFANRRA